MLLGILAGLGSGALWGLVFALPKILTELSSSQVAMGRFLSYGIISGILLCFESKNIRLVLNRPVLRSAFLLSLAGNAVYYSVLVQSVRMAGVPLSSLIIGILPLSIAMLSSRGRLPRMLFFPLFLILVGVSLINVDLFRVAPVEIGVSTSTRLIGVALAITSLLLWTWYAVENAKFLKSHPEISGKLWTSVIGVGTLICMLPIVGIDVAFFSKSTSHLLNSPPTVLAKLAICSIALGAGSSWLATWLWNIASQRLPTSLTGQLIVSETLFALLYGFIVDGRAPRSLELLASVFLITGVVLAINSYRKPSS
jgi:drug/metabolite transporter (DMT)-like permease